MSPRGFGAVPGKRSFAKAVGIALLSTASLAALHGVARSESFVLTGLVLLSERGDGIAYLTEPQITKNQIVAVRRGSTIGPYRLTRILDDRVELEGPSGTVVLPVRGGGTTAGAERAPAAPPRAADARVDTGAASTDSSKGEAVAAGRGARGSRTPFPAAMRDRVRALRKDAGDHNSGGTGDTAAEPRAGNEKSRRAGGGQPGGAPASPNSAAATATLGDMLRAQPGGSEQKQSSGGDSLLGTLLGPR